MYCKKYFDYMLFNEYGMMNVHKNDIVVIILNLLVYLIFILICFGLFYA